jgi:hypothetical protein
MEKDNEEALRITSASTLIERRYMRFTREL